MYELIIKSDYRGVKIVSKKEETCILSMILSHGDKFYLDYRTIEHVDGLTYCTVQTCNSPVIRRRIIEKYHINFIHSKTLYLIPVVTWVKIKVKDY